MIKRAKRQKKFKNMAAQKKKMVGKFNIYITEVQSTEIPFFGVFSATYISL